MDAAADMGHDAPVIDGDPTVGADANTPRIHELFAADMIAQAAQAIAASASSYNIPTYGMISAAGDDVDEYVVEQTNVAAATASTATDNIHVTSESATDMHHHPAQFEEGTASPSGLGLHTAATHPSAASSMNSVTNVPQFHNCPTEAITMDELLEEQKRAQLELNRAEEEVRRAKVLLDDATQHKLNIDARVKALTESSVDAFLNENNKWNEMYKRLVEYKQAHGHCHLMRSPKQQQQPQRNKSVGMKKTKSSSEKGTTLQALGAWASQARLDARRPEGHPDRLESYKVLALDRLGFDWEPRANYWMDMYEQLKAYLKTSGGRMPPRFIDNKKFALGQWCDTQLDNYRKLQSGKKGAYITPRKIEMLEQIGFVWDKRGHVWRENYERLKEFKAKYGHCNATASKNGGDKSFGMWLTKQKGKYINWLEGKTTSKDFSLTDEQAALMDEIGFSECVELDSRRPGGGRRSSKVICESEDRQIDGLVSASCEDIESVAIDRIDP